MDIKLDPDHQPDTQVKQKVCSIPLPSQSRYNPVQVHHAVKQEQVIQNKHNTVPVSVPKPIAKHAPYGQNIVSQTMENNFVTLPPRLNSSFSVGSGQDTARKQILVPQPMEQNYYVTHPPPLSKTYNVCPVQQNVKQKVDNVPAYPHVYDPILSSSSSLIDNTHPNRNTFQSSFNTSYLAGMRVPQLQFFSGEEQEGDVSFKVWKSELNRLIKESVYPDSFILQAIRKSLRGKSRDILRTLGESASPSIILNKLEGIYGNVTSSSFILSLSWRMSPLLTTVSGLRISYIELLKT